MSGQGHRWASVADGKAHYVIVDLAEVCEACAAREALLAPTHVTAGRCLLSTAAQALGQPACSPATGYPLAPLPGPAYPCPPMPTALSSPTSCPMPLAHCCLLCLAASATRAQQQPASWPVACVLTAVWCLPQITGFLGAGKTTLVNHILQGDHGLKIAVIENEVRDCFRWRAGPVHYQAHTGAVLRVRSSAR